MASRCLLTRFIVTTRDRKYRPDEEENSLNNSKERDERNSESAGTSKIYSGAFKKPIKWLLVNDFINCRGQERSHRTRQPILNI